MKIADVRDWVTVVGVVGGTVFMLISDFGDLPSKVETNQQILMNRINDVEEQFLLGIQDVETRQYEILDNQNDLRLHTNTIETYLQTKDPAFSVPLGGFQSINTR